MKLKMQVAVFEKAIAIQIQEQDERFRGRGTAHKVFLASNGFAIESSVRPDIELKKLWLRGESAREDFYVASREFLSDEDRDTFLRRMKGALTEWAEEWEGWGEKKKDSSANEGVWEF